MKRNTEAASASATYHQPDFFHQLGVVAQPNGLTSWIVVTPRQADPCEPLRTSPATGCGTDRNRPSSSPRAWPVASSGTHPVGRRLLRGAGPLGSLRLVHFQGRSIGPGAASKRGHQGRRALTAKASHDFFALDISARSSTSRHGRFRAGSGCISLRAGRARDGWAGGRRWGQAGRRRGCGRLADGAAVRRSSEARSFCPLRLGQQLQSASGSNAARARSACSGRAGCSSRRTMGVGQLTPAVLIRRHGPSTTFRGFPGHTRELQPGRPFCAAAPPRLVLDQQAARRPRMFLALFGEEGLWECTYGSPLRRWAAAAGLRSGASARTWAGVTRLDPMHQCTGRRASWPTQLPGGAPSSATGGLGIEAHQSRARINGARCRADREARPPETFAHQRPISCCTTRAGWCP